MAVGSDGGGGNDNDDGGGDWKVVIEGERMQCEVIQL